MNYVLDVKVSAEIGVLEAVEYYEKIEKGLGTRFLDSWENHISIIKQNPLLFQAKYKNFRQTLIKPYPYHIIYEVENKTIIIYKVVYGGKSNKKRYNKKQ